VEPVDGGANALALAQARVSADAGVSILKKAMDTEKTEAEQLLAALPDVAPSGPIGNLGHRLDVRL
jgi:hypothetical protein